MQRGSSVFKRIAHRGASAEAPENTIPAIQLALEKYRVDMVEIDLRLSKDKVPVVFHDATLERTTDGKGPLSRHSLNELKARDAGFSFDPEGKGIFPYRGKGVTIPTLEEVLRQFPEANFLLEIKEKSPSCVEKILRVIQRFRGKGSLLVGSFHGSVTRELRQLRDSSIKSVFSRDEVLWACLVFALGFKRFSPPAHHASLPRREYGMRLDEAKWIAFLHRCGVKVYYWTIDETLEMEELIKAGADGILTNFPGRLNQVTSGIAPTGG